jgi:hypothetical protein
MLATIQNRTVVLSSAKNIKTILVTLFEVLYWCETLAQALREECTLRVFESRALRRIFGPKRDKVTGALRKLHNAFSNLYFSSGII